ncbi:hypothetical protein ACFW2E_42425, partial [Streptomyces sp. NPDC058964]
LGGAAQAGRRPARAVVFGQFPPLNRAAAGPDDRDPVPWRIALDHARGSGAGPKYFEELWGAAVRRAPHHYGCHVAALRYLAAFRPGSHHACFDFADRAAQDAPPDSLVQALPARAALGCLTHGRGTDGGGTEVRRERLHAAADRAIALSARFPAADPWPAEIRNKLVYVLVRLDRHQDALAQLRLIGPYATSFPWNRLSDDPLGHFLRLRAELLTTARPAPDTRLIPAARRPRTGQGGQARAGDH